MSLDGLSALTGLSGLVASAGIVGLVANAAVGSVALSWANVPGSTYDVRRSPAGAGTWSSLATGLTAPNYADTTAAAGTSYDYQVRAIVGAVTGAWIATATAAPATTPATISCDGNSLTIGQNVSPPNAWPAQLLPQLPGSYTVQNYGVAAQDTLNMAVVAHVKDDQWPASTPGTGTTCVFWELVNAYFDFVPAPLMYRQYRRYGRARWLAGFRRIVTIDGTPRNGVWEATPTPGDREDQRRQVNALLAADFTVSTSNPYVWLRKDATVDYATVLIRLSIHPDFLTPTSAGMDDGTHFTPTGYGEVAALVLFALQIAPLLPAPVASSYLLLDDFAPNVSDLDLNPAGMDRGPGWWNMEGAVWSTTGGAAALATPGTHLSSAMAEAAQAHAMLVCTLTPGASCDAGLAVNYTELGPGSFGPGNTGDADYTVVRVKSGSSGLYTASGGSLTSVAAASPAVTPSTGVPLELVYITTGDRMRMIAGGELVVDHTTASRAGGPQPFFGLWSNSDTGTTFSGYSVAAWSEPTAQGFLDTFQDADNTLIAAHTPDSANFTWAAVDGTWKIISNVATYTGASFHSGIIVMDAGSPNISITLNDGVVDNAHALLRFVDENNYIKAGYTTFGVEIREVVAGNGTQLAVGSTYPNNFTGVFTASIDSSNLVTLTYPSMGVTIQATSNINPTTTTHAVNADSGASGSLHKFSASVPQPPTVSSAVCDATTLSVTFNAPVCGATGYTVSASGGALTLTYLKGAGTSTLVFTASRTIHASETLTLTYAPGTTASFSGTVLAAFSGQAVANHSGVP